MQVASEGETVDPETTAETVVSVETAFRRVKAETDLQFDLPAPDTPIPEVREPRGDGWFARLMEALAPLAELVIWAALALLCAAILFFIVRSIMDGRLALRTSKVAGEEASTPLYEPEAARVRTLLEQVDALAAEGRYREAVHMLLFRAIEDIDRARPGQVRRSLTSREIARLPALTDRTRGAFVTIARINERGWFAGLDTDRGQFDAARAAYAQFDGRPSRSEAQPRLSGLTA